MLPLLHHPHPAFQTAFTSPTPPAQHLPRLARCPRTQCLSAWRAPKPESCTEKILSPACGGRGSHEKNARIFFMGTREGGRRPEGGIQNRVCPAWRCLQDAHRRQHFFLRQRVAVVRVHRDAVGVVCAVVEVVAEGALVRVVLQVADGLAFAGDAADAVFPAVEVKDLVQRRAVCAFSTYTRAQPLSCLAENSNFVPLGGKTKRPLRVAF